MFYCESDLKGLQKSAKILSYILDKLKNSIVNGERDLSELDYLAGKLLLDNNSQSAFKGYKPDFSKNSYQYNICTSVNDEIVHGLPLKDKILVDGDIVSIDMALSHEGWFSDAAFTIGIGNISQTSKKLIQTAELCFKSGLDSCYPGKTTGDVGYCIHSVARTNGFEIAYGLTGHGIGHTLHEKPNVYNHGPAAYGDIIMEGMSLCIEPIIVQGSHLIVESEDGWTIKTADGMLAAHYEHTVAVTSKETIILTEI